MARSNISSSLQALKIQVSENVKNLTEEIAEEAGKDVIELQLKDEFWKNQTFTAVGSIGWNAEGTGNYYKMSVGFINGNPAEGRENGSREYGQYLAEYKKGLGNAGIHFLGACQNALIKRFMEKISTITDYRSTRSTFTNGNWEQAE